MVDYSRFDELDVRLDGKILRVTLNKPDRRNIIDDAVNRQLGDVFTEAAMDRDVATVVLTGEGKVFCAGGDMVKMQKKIDDPSLFYAGVHNSRRLVFSVLDCPKPIIACVNGDAIGLGATLALLCDIVIVNEDARLADPHTKVGLVCGDGGALIWPALIGYARAKRYLLSGDLITGKDAEAIGLVTFAVPKDELSALTEEWAQKLANGALQSIAGTKITMNVPLRQAAQSLLDVGMAYEGLSNITRDHQEAVTAFIEKRKPEFTGE
jgi:enoyl-CoA hydratase